MTFDQEVAWLAGVLEGEGSFMMTNCWVANKAGKPYRYPKIVVGMTDEDVIARVAALFGTKVGKVKNAHGKKAVFRAIVSATPAVEWMRVLRPFMGIRRGERIDSILAEWNDRVLTQVQRRESCKVAALQRYRGANGAFIEKRKAA